MSGATATVSADQRYTKARPCPICGGCDRDVRGKGARCFGYRSADGTYAHCTREEQAGGLEPNDKSGTYAHRLEGPCKCGVTHGETIYRGANTHYEYRDERGAILFRVVRTPDKSFFQQTPEGTGWKNGLNGARRVLYRLPELLAADANSTVFVVEGEKDVDAMWARGLVATCNPMGAGKWGGISSLEALRGRHVVVIPDDDKPGHDHAAQVKTSLRGVAASVRIVKLPAKDASDWFAAGHSAAELADIVSASDDEEKPVAQPVRWRRCRDLVDEILRQANDPWVSLALGGEEIVRVRLGGIVLLIGGTGRGKTSLAATLLVEHAQGGGPAVPFSLELPDDEWTARCIGTRCDASWMSVLQGEVSRERMLEVLPERLAIVGRDQPLEALGEAVDAMRAAYPNEPILAAVDYAQLIGADSDDDIRPRIGKVMRQLDRLARDKRVVLIVLSQGSRASARALSSGELIGASTTDAGAESADLERWATVTLAIGQHKEPAEDGSCAADLSIGKSRMGGGDRVLPARYYGRSGLWRITGEARRTADVVAERQLERDTAKQTAAELAMAQFASKSSKPVSKRDLRGVSGVKGLIADRAIAALKQRGELVDVRIRVRGMRRGEWPLWTPERWAASGLKPDSEGDN